jgi:cytochrome b561
MATARSHVTRFLHLLLLVMVLHQLLGSQIMERPLPGDEPAWPFVLHEWIGIATLGPLAAFWLWTLIRDRRETPLNRLLPWFSIAGWRAVVVDALRTAGRLLGARYDDDHADGALASAVHGLGVLVASAMALTGSAYFFIFEGTSDGRFVLGLHKAAANLMWAFVIGHAGAAALHVLLGDGVLSRMFWIRSRRESRAKAR